MGIETAHDALQHDWQTGTFLSLLLLLHAFTLYNAFFNAIINTKITSKKLRLSAEKCNHLHISKRPGDCYNNLKVGKSAMKKATECSYLGDILSSSGSLDATIEQRRQKGVGICSQISGIVDGLSLGSFFIINSLLSLGDAKSHL